MHLTLIESCVKIEAWSYLGPDLFFLSLCFIEALARCVKIVAWSYLGADFFFSSLCFIEASDATSRCLFAFHLEELDFTVIGSLADLD